MNMAETVPFRPSGLHLDSTLSDPITELVQSDSNFIRKIGMVVSVEVRHPAVSGPDHQSRHSSLAQFLLDTSTAPERLLSRF